MAPAPFEFIGQLPCHLSSVGDLSGVDLRVEDRWLSVDETALYLVVKRNIVYKWIDRKQMLVHKVGCLW